MIRRRRPWSPFPSSKLGRGPRKPLPAGPRDPAPKPTEAVEEKPKVRVWWLPRDD